MLKILKSLDINMNLENLVKNPGEYTCHSEKFGSFI